MKVTKILQFLTVVLLITIASSGCRLKPAHLTAFPAGKDGKGTGTSGTGQELPGGKGTGAGENVFGSESPLTPMGKKPMNTGTWDTEKLKAEMINFDVDSATIKNSEKPKLKRVADYLKANPTHDILIKGHCDERGTEAYNLALGDKRSLAAREYLILLGGSGDVLYTQSFGETQPIEALNHERAYSKNRRCEFVVVLPAGQ